MLVLSRRTGERILVGNDVVVTVLGMRGQEIRLGIEAPHSVPIWREEVVVAGAARGSFDFDEPARPRASLK